MSNIIVGETTLPINLLEKNAKDNVYRGTVEIKLRNNMLIGYIDLVATFEEITKDKKEIISESTNIEENEVKYFF
jgi:hypothetical protein